MIRTYYNNEKDLLKGLENASKAKPNLYFYGVSLFNQAYIVQTRRLNPQAPTDSIILSNGRTYWKNGKQRKFTEKQIIKDQQTGGR